MENSDIKAFGGLMLALFLVMIITGVVYIGADYFKESACEQDGVRSWSGGTCYTNSTENVEATVTALTKIGIVETVISIALGLLSLVVLMNIFKLVIKAARGFGAGGFN